MRADVRRSDNMINDFQVRSPVATAAVRGTSFTFDGMRLEVVKGNVDLAGKKGGKVNVSQGGSVPRLQRIAVRLILQKATGKMLGFLQLLPAEKTAGRPFRG